MRFLRTRTHLYRGSPPATRIPILLFSSVVFAACSSSDEPGYPAFAAGEDILPGEGDDGSFEGDGSSGYNGDEIESSGSDGGSSSESGDSADAIVPQTAGLSLCEAAWDADWLFCEDFESAGPLAERFFEYQPGDNAFLLDETIGASGHRSLRTTYMSGLENAGWLNISIGDNPATRSSSPQVEPGEQFEELYWRFRIRLEDDWPNVGPGRLTRAMVITNEDRYQAVVAAISADSEAVALSGTATSCVVEQGSPCSDFDDVDGRVEVASMDGEEEIFSSMEAGEWHCIEVHVQLNRPGDTDGKFEFWVDERLDGRVNNIDLRGSWSAYGLNMITIENFWDGGAPGVWSRWIDDIVISTDRIGCNG